MHSPEVEWSQNAGGVWGLAWLCGAGTANTGPWAACWEVRVLQTQSNPGLGWRLRAPSNPHLQCPCEGALMQAHRAAATLENRSCDPRLYNLMTGMRPLPLLSRLPSLPAGQRSTVTNVGMRRGAKCPRPCVQSWMLISISSITCSNTDLSHSGALSLLPFFLPAHCHKRPGPTGSNCLVFVWLLVMVGPWLCWPRHFTGGLPSRVGHWRVG